MFKHKLQNQEKKTIHFIHEYRCSVLPNPPSVPACSYDAVGGHLAATRDEAIWDLERRRPAAVTTSSSVSCPSAGISRWAEPESCYTVQRKHNGPFRLIPSRRPVRPVSLYCPSNATRYPGGISTQLFLF